MKKNWTIKKPTGSLPADIGLSPLVRRLLENRGFSDEATVKEFLEPDYKRDIHNPFLFQDMEKVVARMNAAILNHEKIALFGDYDADGVCSSAVLASTLTYLGGQVVDVYLPDRQREGYGLNTIALDSFIAQGVTLVVTLDCGTSNIAEILYAKEHALDVIVIDHHHVPKERPEAFALLNPKMPAETYPFRFLASVGMAYKVSQALLQKKVEAEPGKQKEHEAFEKWLLDLVAIATVTDMVPLVGENRTLEKFGLLVLNKTKRPGLKALIQLINKDGGQLDTEDIGFRIGPRINAAGRMNHANAAYALLMSQDGKEAVPLALTLEQENRNRQVETERITAEALASLGDEPSDKVLIASGGDWPVGLVGLVAGRLVERFQRPVLVIGKSPQGLTGSGRSIPAFDLIEALHSIPEVFEKFGGHSQACGLTMKDGESIEVLRQHLNTLADAGLREEDLIPSLMIDETIMLQDVGQELWEQIKQFEPYGMDNPKPKFLISGVKVVGLGTVGKTGQHLKLTLSDEAGSIRQAIGFRLGEWASKLRLGANIDIVAELIQSTWRDQTELKLRLIDLRLSST